MKSPIRLEAQARSLAASRALCPTWCVTGHRSDLGEDDWLHSSEPLSFVDSGPARLAMSIDPDTGEVDGPYVLIGTSEYSLAGASALAEGLLRLVAVHSGSHSSEEVSA